MNYLDPVIDDDKPEVDLTSMLDVVFNMLVFFHNYRILHPRVGNSGVAAIVRRARAGGD